MKKSLLFVLLLTISVVFISCDNKKDDGTPPPASYILSNLSVTGTDGFDVNDKKLILDKGGNFTFNGVSAEGSLMLGGNKFIKYGDTTADNDTSPLDTTNITPTEATLMEGTLSFKFSPSDENIEYNVTASQTGSLKTWKSSSLCFAGNPECERLNGVLKAMRLIGRYYIQQIKIVDYSDADCNGKVITGSDNDLVGELIASPDIFDNKVDLKLYLKFQFTSATNIGTCSYSPIFYGTFDDTIVFSTENPLNLDQVFIDEGMLIVGNQTVMYTPKEKLAGSIEYTDKLINGAKLEIILKKATSSQAVTFDNHAPYYN